MKFLFVILIVFIAISSYADDNTIDDIMIKYNIVSNFGDIRGEQFQKGIELSANEENIYSIMDGELVFYNRGLERDINYGKNAFLIIQSNNNHRVLYSNIKEESIDFKKNIYKKNEIIGTTKNQEENSNLYLEIEDIENKRFVNPLFFLKTTDRLPPIIRDIYFITGDNSVVSFLDSTRLKRGGKLFINCMDRIDRRQLFFTPYQIKVIIGGVEYGGLKFDYLQKSGSNLLLSDTNLKFEDIYSNSENFFYYLMEYNTLPGLVGFHIIVEDFFGNKAEYRKALRIMPPDL